MAHGQGRQGIVAAIENRLHRRGAAERRGHQRIRRLPDGKVEIRDVSGAVDLFDDVVLASHANQSLAMLTDASPDERALLSCFRYTPNTAVLGADKRRGAADLVEPGWNNLATPATHEEATVSYWMNALQDLDIKTDLFVTLNPSSKMTLKGEIRREEYDHPIFDGPAKEAQGKLWALQGQRNGCSVLRCLFWRRLSRGRAAIRPCRRRRIGRGAPAVDGQGRVRPHHPGRRSATAARAA